MANKFFSPESLWLDNILAMVRVFTGVALIYHGMEMFDKTKMENFDKMLTDVKMSKPLFMAYLGKICEMVCGILLVFGLFTRVASIILIVTMFIITFKIGEGRILMEEQHPFLLGVIGIIFLFAGGGRWSLDHLFFGNKRKELLTRLSTFE